RGRGSGEPSPSRSPGRTSYSALSVGLTISDSGLEFSNRVGALAFPPPTARNAACHCGSDRKYKRCCYEQDEVVRRQLRLPTLPPWILSARGKLHQFEKYACQVFVLPALLASLNDTRRAPEISTFDVVNSLLHSALSRRSLRGLALRGHRWLGALGLERWPLPTVFGALLQSHARRG